MTHTRYHQFAKLFEENTSISLEDNSDGNVTRETELVFYAMLTPAYQQVLQDAVHREAQEQWELRIPKTPDNVSAGRFRVRKTSPIGNDPGESEYTLTSKIKMADGKGDNEVSVVSSKAQFEQFKAMSPRGMVKHRYVFVVHGRSEKWEIDFYADKDGVTAPWVKMDFEVTNGDFTCPPFPAGLVEESSVIHDGMTDQAVKDKIHSLYEQYFITKNSKSFSAPIENEVQAQPPAGEEEVLPPESTP